MKPKKGKAGTPSLAQPGPKRDTMGRSMEKKRGRKALPKLVTIHLQLRHSINGHFYGPGTVTVSKTKAEMFLNTESEAAHKEVSLQQQQAYLLVNRGGVIGKRQVPFAQFDNILANSEVQF